MKSWTLNWKNSNAELGYFRHSYIFAVTSIIRQCYHSVNTISLTSHTSKCDLWSKNDSTFFVKVWLLIVSPIFRTAVMLQIPHTYQNQIQTVPWLVIPNHCLWWLTASHKSENQFCLNIGILATNVGCSLSVPVEGGKITSRPRRN